ncbi:MAG TPA: proline racemase family protein [Micromonosporaceae bacterium]|nr:proline racemase family protein [Micromonosporaceae bacterium]
MLTTVDYHTAGEPFRIVTGGAPEPAGATILDRRATAQQGELDRLRALLCNEPRGHADMYGCFLVPPDDPAAHTGVLFWHKDGFSTACGHGTIALATYLVEEGIVACPDNGVATVVIDVPSGRVNAAVRREAGRVVSVAFVNVPSYVLATRVTADTTAGQVSADLSYGGAIYASVAASSVGLRVTPDHLPALIDIGRQVKWALNDTPQARHPTDPRLSGVYGTIWYDDLPTDTGVHQRNCTVFADGEVDRSPCGSGTSARLALLWAGGWLTTGDKLVHDSIIGSRFLGRVLGQTSADGRPAVVTEVEGSAYRTGEHRFVLDPDDPLGLGFQLR